MQIRLFLISAIFISKIYYSNEYYRGDSLVQQGVYAFYNYEFDKAISILDNARTTFPNHPGVHLIWAASRWLRNQAHDPIDQTYIKLRNDLNEIEPIYNELVLKHKYDYNFKLYQGSAIGLSARVSLGKKEWLKTLYQAHRGFKIIEQVYERSPENLDSKLPIGIVQYYAGISNPLLRTAVKIYGIDASRISGLENINLAADKGKWSWIEAKSILCTLYLWVEDEPILSIKHSKDLVDHFPENYYFNLLYFEGMIRAGKIDQSYDVLNEMEIILTNLTDRQKNWYRPYQYYEEALLSFYKGDFTKTLSKLELAIELYSGELDIILGNAYLLRGMANDRLFKRDAAKSSYIECIKLNNFSSAITKAKKYLNHPYQEH